VLCCIVSIPAPAISLTERNASLSLPLSLPLLLSPTEGSPSLPLPFGRQAAAALRRSPLTFSSSPGLSSNPWATAAASHGSTLPTSSGTMALPAHLSTAARGGEKQHLLFCPSAARERAKQPSAGNGSTIEQRLLCVVPVSLYTLPFGPDCCYYFETLVLSVRLQASGSSAFSHVGPGHKLGGAQEAGVDPSGEGIPQRPRDERTQEPRHTARRPRNACGGAETKRPMAWARSARAHQEQRTHARQARTIRKGRKKESRAGTYLQGVRW